MGHLTTTLTVTAEQLAALVDLFDRNGIGESFSVEGDPLLVLSHNARTLHRRLLDRQAEADAAGEESGLGSMTGPAGET